LGAWEVLRRQEDSFIPLMQEMVELWDPAQRRDSDADQFAAMTVILDVLIQRNAIVSIAGVNTIANVFPDQVLICLPRCSTSATSRCLGACKRAAPWVG
jgi:hypothetical protein